MSKKSHFRGSFHKKYGKRAQRLFKSSSQQHYHIHWSLARKLSSKKSLLLTCQILGLLLNTLAADEKYPVLNRENLTIQIQTQLSQKKYFFDQFFTWFFKSRLNLKHFQKKDDPYTFFIFEVTDSENIVRQMSKKSRFRGCFNKEYGKRAQALLKCASQHLYHIHWSLAGKLCSKNSLVLTCQILGLLVNTFAADENYQVLNRDNLRIHIQMQLS